MPPRGQRNPVEPLIRTSVQLTAEHRRKLAELAERDDHSESHHIRKALDLYLAVQASDGRRDREAVPA
jgi:predicted transcriptional regulator